MYGRAARATQKKFCVGGHGGKERQVRRPHCYWLLEPWRVRMGPDDPDATASEDTVLAAAPPEPEQPTPPTQALPISPTPPPPDDATPDDGSPAAALPLLDHFELSDDEQEPAPEQQSREPPRPAAPAAPSPQNLQPAMLAVSAATSVENMVYRDVLHDRVHRAASVPTADLALSFFLLAFVFVLLLFEMRKIWTQTQ